MKKTSLMGASVVAAALLAVAPVAAPAISSVSGTQVVKADTTSDAGNVFNNIQVTSLSYDLNKTADSDKMGSQAFATAASSLSTDYSKSLKVKDLMGTDNKASGFLVNFQNSVPVGDPLVTKDIQDDTVKISVKSGDLQLQSAAELTNKISDIEANGGSLTATYTIYDGSNKELASKSFTLNASAPSTAATVTSLYATAPASFDVQSGTPVSNYNYGATANVKAVDQNGKTVNVTTSAKVQQLSTTVEGNTTTNTWNDATGNFAKETDNNGVKTANEYRQQVTLTLPANAKDATVYVNNVKLNNINGSAVFNRDINVKGSDEANADFTMDKINGVVTVKSDNTAVTLYDKNGKKIDERYVLGGTSWFTNGKRTILSTGKVYYKVSPTEYISADDVASYVANGSDSSSNTTTDNGSVKFVKEHGTFTVNDGANYGNVLLTYKDGKFSTIERVIAANSQWRYDKKAVLGDRTYYKISPTEWASTAYGTAVADK